MRRSSEMRTSRAVVVASVIALGCGSDPAPRRVEGPAAAVARVDADPRTQARALVDEAEAALADGDLERAERRLRAALGLAAGDELVWRIRARLAVVLARRSQTEEAREVAGLMCSELDPGMTPAYFAPLLAELEAAYVCRGTCARVAACCRAFVTTITAASGATLDANETCAAVDEVARNAALTEEACLEMLSTWRQSLAAMAGVAIPAECE